VRPGSPGDSDLAGELLGVASNARRGRGDEVTDEPVDKRSVR